MYKSIQRLKLSKSDRILVFHAPKTFSEFEQYFTTGIDREIKGRAYPSVFYFTKNLEIAETEISKILRATAFDALFWFCYPKQKKQSKELPITREDVRKFFASHRLEPVSQRTINENWTALRIRPQELVTHRRSAT